MLKKCPKCSFKNIEATVLSKSGLVMIVCPNKECGISTPPFETMAELEAWWNKRALKYVKHTISVRTIEPTDKQLEELYEPKK